MTPRAVTMYECGGGYTPDEHREKNSLCVPVEKVEVSMELCGDTGEIVHVKKLFNHTKCAMR